MTRATLFSQNFWKLTFGNMLLPSEPLIICRTPWSFFFVRDIEMKNCLHVLYHLLKHNRKPRPNKGPGTYLSKVDCDWPPVFSELGVLGLISGTAQSLAAALLWVGAQPFSVMSCREKSHWRVGVCCGPCHEHRGSSHPTAKRLAREPPSRTPPARDKETERLTWPFHFLRETKIMHIKL